MLLVCTSGIRDVHKVLGLIVVSQIKCKLHDKNYLDLTKANRWVV